MSVEEMLRDGKCVIQIHFSIKGLKHHHQDAFIEISELNIEIHQIMFS
jgi:hypothetical protein